jgi:hypothetical protein
MRWTVFCCEYQWNNYETALNFEFLYPVKILWSFCKGPIALLLLWTITCTMMVYVQYLRGVYVPMGIFVKMPIHGQFASVAVVTWPLGILHGHNGYYFTIWTVAWYAVCGNVPDVTFFADRRLLMSRFDGHFKISQVHNMGNMFCSVSRVCLWSEQAFMFLKENMINIIKIMFLYTHVQRFSWLLQW